MLFRNLQFKLLRIFRNYSVVLKVIDIYQTEDFLPDRIEENWRVALLEVGSAAATD